MTSRQKSPAQLSTKTIAVVLDERLSREKSHLLMRAVNAMRRLAKVEVIKAGTTEDELLTRLQESPVDLLLIPWYRYLAWRKIDGHYGISRTQGPTAVGYFGDQVLPYELGVQAEHLRCILLDLTNLRAHEAMVLLGAMLDDTKRSGLRPMLHSYAPVYTEDWMSTQGQGFRLDTVLSLPEITRYGWNERAPALRITLNALWSLIYEEGPGKAELGHGADGKTARAHFQVAGDDHCLLFRLGYQRRGFSHRNALEQFWPNSGKPTLAAQLLMRYADFLRVHTFADHSQVEVTVGFMPSAPAEGTITELHSLWIEPLSDGLLLEPFAEKPNALRPDLKPLPPVPMPPQNVQSLEVAIQVKDRQVHDMHRKMRELRQQLQNRDETLQELRKGGVGVAKPLPPPDMETLLEACRRYFMDARGEMDEIEYQLQEVEKSGTEPPGTDQMRRRAIQLSDREQAWIQQLASILTTLRDHKKKAA